MTQCFLEFWHLQQRRVDRRRSLALPNRMPSRRNENSENLEANASPALSNSFTESVHATRLGKRREPKPENSQADSKSGNGCYNFYI